MRSFLEFLLLAYLVLGIIVYILILASAIYRLSH